MQNLPLVQNMTPPIHIEDPEHERTLLQAIVEDWANSKINLQYSFHYYKH